MASSYGKNVGGPINPISRVGAMVYNGAFDDVALSDILSQRNGATPYPGTGNPQIFDILPNEVVYYSKEHHGIADPDSRANGLTALNGLGNDAARAYPNNEEMQLECIKHRIIPMGTANERGVRNQLGERENGFAGQIAGLATLSADAPFRPGQLAKAVLPKPGSMQRRAGMPESKYRLQVVPADPRSSAFAVLTHIHELMSNPARWRQAMNADMPGTDAKMSAAKNIIDSYGMAGLAAIQEAITMGLLQPTESLRNLVPGPDKQNMTGVQDVIGAANPEQERQRIRANGEIGYLTAAYLAEYQGYTTSQPNATRLSAKAAGSLKLLRVNTVNRTFYNGRNGTFEMGYIPAGNGEFAKKLGRHENTGALRKGHPRGELVELQLNHVVRAIGGYDEFVHAEQSFILGKTVTGGRPDGSGMVHVALGVCRP